ncbi:receptor expression-enhancing protein 6-like [Callorhinchus milii]|uniref:receptor expression-enhancing protein 6-like n=1 Tax=Callorhinchus milii TaxID=7868 RepID=UPI001C3FD0A9|nr:receptor expression-enhancing protein 6-like [Callorhinchus milii]
MVLVHLHFYWIIYTNFITSFRVLAIENENKEEKMKWLMYWVIYASFGTAERLTGIFLYVLPGYHRLKSLFLLWCMAPVDWNGSRIIYFNVIRPIFLMHWQEEKLDEKSQEPLENAKKQVPQKTNTFTPPTKSK